VQAQVLSGSLVRYTRARGGMYHLLVHDDSGSLACKFFHGFYLEGKFKAGQRIVLHGKADLDPNRPARIEMINPEYELLGSGESDSTEVGRIVPIYEAIGGVTSRMMRRVIYAALENLGGNASRSAAGGTACAAQVSLAGRSNSVRPFSAANRIG